MNYEQWKAAITESSKQAGTYQPYFDNLIDVLAQIMARKDAAAKQFRESGEDLTIEYTNKAGATNVIVNPVVKIMNDLDKQALTYWRELGLTPLKVKDASKGGSNKVSLREALAAIEREIEEKERAEPNAPAERAEKA